MATLRQYGVLVVGLLMAGGFAFGGMASYSQMIDSGGGNNDRERPDVVLPTKNFQMPLQPFSEGQNVCKPER